MVGMEAAEREEAERAPNVSAIEERWIETTMRTLDLLDHFFALQNGQRPGERRV